jgi:hypothetical protein
VFLIQFSWPSKAKSLTCDALKLTHKNGKTILNTRLI